MTTVVTKAVKEFVHSINMNVSKDAIQFLDTKVQGMLLDAKVRAQANNRKTILKQDL